VRELDYRREAENQKSFFRFFKSDKQVMIPAIYEQYTTSDTLVMEYVDGEKINNLKGWIQFAQPEDIAEKLIHVYMKQFLDFGTVHYDPHPGNILVNEKGQIVLLDFGMTGVLPADTKKSISRMMYYLLNSDYLKLLEILEKAGFLKKGVNRYRLLPVVESVVASILSAASYERESLYGESLDKILDDLAVIVYSQPFVLPTQWAFIAKTFGTLFGVLSGIYPAIDYIEQLRPYTSAIVRDNLPDLIKQQIGLYLSLPQKLDSVIEDMRRKKFLFPVDYYDLDDRVESLKRFFVQTVALFLTGFGVIASCWFLYFGNYRYASAVLLSLIVPASIVILSNILFRKDKQIL
jgi:predicted unusual protein kinase regulating ubiquinone biosynthesis (AarF/ABC1/UbiB family)